MEDRIFIFDLWPTWVLLLVWFQPIFQLRIPAKETEIVRNKYDSFPFQIITANATNQVGKGTDVKSECCQGPCYQKWLTIHLEQFIREVSNFAPKRVIVSQLETSWTLNSGRLLICVGAVKLYLKHLLSVKTNKQTNKSYQITQFEP